MEHSFRAALERRPRIVPVKLLPWSCTSRVRPDDPSEPSPVQGPRPASSLVRVVSRGAFAETRNVADVDRSSPRADIIEEARRVTTAAQEERVPLKLTGGLGIYFHAPSAREPPLRREYQDLDFVSLSLHRVPVQAFLARLGYEPDTPFNTLQGLRRLRYWDSVHHRQVDIFLDQIRMCHTIDLRHRVHLPDGVLTPADLLLTKMQIVEFNLKDLADLVALLMDHPMGATDGDEINAPYIAGLLAQDWGFYRTLQLNLDRVRGALAQFAVPTDAVCARLAALWQVIEMHPKPLRWRLRARIGDRLRWYELPEPDEAG